jgi:WD40 repeat protein
VGHEGQVSGLALSSNGQFLATVGDRENVTRLWNTETGQLIAALDGTKPLFGPDSHVLLTTRKKNVKFWDAASGKLKLTLTGHERDITAAAFSPDGSRLATASEDGTVKLWDAATGRTSTTLSAWPVKKIPRYRIISRALSFPPIVCVEFSPDGKFIVTQGIDVVSINNIVKLWETATGRLIKEFKDLFRVIDFSPDSNWLGFISLGEDVGLLNLKTLMIQPTSGVEPYFLNQYAFSPDSRTYVTASGHEKYYATLIDVSTGQVTRKIPLFAKWGFDPISVFQKDADILSFHPSSKFLMGANHNSIRMWTVSTGELVLETTEGRDPASFTPDGKLLVTVGKDKKTVLLWEVVSN